MGGMGAMYLNLLYLALVVHLLPVVVLPVLPRPIAQHAARRDDKACRGRAGGLAGIVQRAQPQRMMVEAIVCVLAEMTLQAGRGAKKLRKAAPELPDAQRGVLNRFGLLSRHRGQQIDLMAQPGQRRCQLEHRFAGSAVPRLEAGDDLGDLHRVTGQLTTRPRDHRLSDKQR